MFKIITVQENGTVVATLADANAGRRTEMEQYANDVVTNGDEADSYCTVFEAF